MLLNIWNDIGNWFAESFENIKDFFMENSRNPLLWIAIIIVGLLIFEMVYHALHRD